jgi:hypothetical protein
MKVEEKDAICTTVPTYHCYFYFSSSWESLDGEIVTGWLFGC